MAPSQEEFEVTPEDSAVLDETGASPCKPDSDDTSGTIQDDKEPEVDETDGNLVAKPGQMNEFGVRRSTVQNVLDLAVFAANISQLRIILTVGPNYLNFYNLMLSCVSLSLVFQVMFAIVMLALKIRDDQMHSESRDPEAQTKSKRLRRDRLADLLNYFSMVLVLLVLLLNIVISSFVTVRNNSSADNIVEGFTGAW